MTRLQWRSSQEVLGRYWCYQKKKGEGGILRHVLRVMVYSMETILNTEVAVALVYLTSPYLTSRNIGDLNVYHRE